MKRFLKFVMENFEVNYVEVFKVRILYVFEEFVKGYFYICGKKCRGVIDIDVNSVCFRNFGVSDFYCLFFIC